MRTLAFIYLAFRLVSETIGLCYRDETERIYARFPAPAQAVLVVTGLLAFALALVVVI